MVAAMVYGFEPVRALADRKFYRDKSYRDLAKRGSHGSNYYGQPYTLAQQMKCDQEAAAQFQARYFKAFPGISAWHRYKQRELVNKGYLVNPFGFRRTFWGRTWDDATLRKAIAFSPQSTVGILTNVALHKLWDRFEPSGDVQILVNGHDAVIGQVRTSKLAELLPQVLDTITIPFHITDINGITRLCTIPWEIAIGSNWGKCTKDNPDGLKEWRPPT
jgi:DNA polymerase I-like protein with 3'-5' exonuclease and polymerase domains